MASKNVETLRAAHESWNKRDFPGVVKNAAEGLVYIDKARSQTCTSRDKFREWVEGWAKAFPDGRITSPEYIDAGDIVVTRFTTVGTNHGAFGAMQPTGRKITLPYCEIFRFDKEGRFVSGEGYYDLYTLLTQLGHVQPIPAAA